MTERILVVTPPDDIFYNGFRLLSVDLKVDQSNELSSSLKNLKTNHDIIVYSWKIGADITWLLDKIHKSNAIIFNAESLDQALVGFLAGQKRSAYFGDLKTIKQINNSVVFDRDQCTRFLNRYLESYEQ